MVTLRWRFARSGEGARWGSLHVQLGARAHDAIGRKDWLLPEKLRQEMGQLLLMDALRRSLQAAAGIAAMAVLVDAKDDAAEAFCRHFSFLPLQHQPRRLFLPMKSIAGLLVD